MRARNSRLAVALLAFASLGVTSASAQRKPPAAQAPVEVSLNFEREVFDYPGMGRRDPFTPLTGKEGVGPRFEQLSLRGIIYSPDASRSVALLVDGAGKIYRVRRGDRVGNVRVLSVEQRRVVLSVENFGRARQEQLELKRPGAEEPAQ